MKAEAPMRPGEFPPAGGFPSESMTLPEAARIMRESVKDKSYRAFPMGGEAGAYLRWKRGMITTSTYRDYEACLDKLARTFPDLEIKDFEPPVGTERLEELLDKLWGDGAPRTYNKNLSILKDFFKWAALKGKLHGDPTLQIVRHKKRDVLRESYSEDTILGIIAAQEDLRDRICCRLLLRYGLRKGALRGIQFKHFDHTRRRLTIFTKGEKIRDLPIVSRELWFDLERLILDIGADPNFYLLNKRKQVWRGYNMDVEGSSKFETVEYHDKPMGEHGAHDWWYGCLEKAGLVPKGTTSGEKMHKARHTAGQRVLDETGNLKAAQKLLGHASMQTTGDHYTDWDIDQLAETMRGLDD
jgi:site-specific recombinase XerC